MSNSQRTFVTKRNLINLAEKLKNKYGVNVGDIESTILEAYGERSKAHAQATLMAKRILDVHIPSPWKRETLEPELVEFIKTYLNGLTSQTV